MGLLLLHGLRVIRVLRETFKITIDGKAGNLMTLYLYFIFLSVLIPLYATTAHLKGHFVLVIENAELWWILKYEGILRKLSYFPFVLLGKERYIHCFPELIVGLRFHDELSIFPELMPKPQFNIQKFKVYPSL